MWARGDGRLDLDRACGLWHQGFAKGRGEGFELYYGYMVISCFFFFVYYRNVAVFSLLYI